VKIGELARAAGTQIETVRYYEREGLLPEPGRSDSNYRIYGPSHLERLSFIRQCRALDMNLDEIRVLLRFKDAPADSCGEVNALLDEHIGHVDQRILELQGLRTALQSLRERCADPQDAAHCGILNELSSRASPAPPGRGSHVGHAHPGGRKVV
jgi:Cd(II)/Pb(II)-responsive transcriptional regulator